MSDLLNKKSVHEPVLLHEVIKNLIHKVDEKIPWYFDGTLGGAGHALAISKSLDGNLNMIGLDRDMEAVKRAEGILKNEVKSLILECESFRNIDLVLSRAKIEAVDYILLDLGISSDELDLSGRGFTFQKDEPLLMTMGNPNDYSFTAKDIVNDWDEEVIADVIFGYSEERFARRIARAIVNYRTKKQIETSGELAEIIKSSVPTFYRKGKLHPATKTFQALRISVNDELGALKDGLAKCYASLNHGGRMGVISFHSLEDRIVKHFYKEQQKTGAIILTKRPIRPTDQEIADNPRSRSAKLRIIEKIFNN